MLKITMCLLYTSLIECYLDLKIAMLAKDYMNIKHLSHGLMLGCGSIEEKIQFYKFVSNTNAMLIGYQDCNNSLFEFQQDIMLFQEKKTKKLSKSDFAIIVDTKCTNFKNVLKWGESQNIFDNHYHWLFVDFYKIINETHLNGIDFRLDSNVNLAFTENDYWVIHNIYNIWKNETVIIPYGVWTTDDNESINKIKSKLTLFSTESEIIRRKNLEGVEISAVVVITYKPQGEDLIHYLSTPNQRQLDTMHRYTYALYMLLMDIFNFRVKIHITNSWGAYINGTWNGVIGALQRQEAEVSITPSEIKTERVSIVDQTTIIWVAKPCIIFRHPRDKSTGIDQFMNPLSKIVWFCILMIGIITVIVLRFVYKQEVETSKTDNYEYYESVNSWSLISLDVLGTITQQDFYSDLPKRSYGKITVLIMTTFSFLIFQFYSASIVSSLLTDSPKTITSLSALTESKLQILIEDIKYNRDFFEIIKDKTVLKLYNEKLKPKGLGRVFVTPDYGIQKVKQGGYAFQVDVAFAYERIAETFNDESICQLTEIELFPPKTCTLAMRKGSPYRQHFNYGLRKIHESGLMKHHKNVWLSPKPICNSDAKYTPESLTIVEMSSAFIMLGIISGVSLIILALEKIVYYYK